LVSNLRLSACSYI